MSAPLPNPEVLENIDGLEEYIDIFISQMLLSANKADGFVLDVARGDFQSGLKMLRLAITAE